MKAIHLAADNGRSTECNRLCDRLLMCGSDKTETWQNGEHTIKVAYWQNRDLVTCKKCRYMGGF